MEAFHPVRCALGIYVAAVIFAGCNAGSSSIAAPSEPTQQNATQLGLNVQALGDVRTFNRSESPNATRLHHTPSWMASEATTEDLLYVGGNSGDVTVYSYPRGRLLGTLTGFYLPAGECVDKAGNVFITDLGLGKIFEYRHGGKKPIQTLQSGANGPAGCAIDPTTGNLAVTYLGGAGSGYVAIFPNAQGTATTYTDPNIYDYYWCGYDPQGNLYVDGQAYNPRPFKFAELPKGSGTFTDITLNQKINWPAGVQWDGKYVAVGDQATSIIYQFAISGSTGSLEGTTALNGGQYVQQFWIQGTRVIGGDSGSYNNVHYWNYPAGGNPTKTITKGVGGPIGMTVSKAPR
jgi:hypothetical protein